MIATARRGAKGTHTQKASNEMYDDYLENDRERNNGFITNISKGFRRYIALHYAAWKTGKTIIIKNNATDVYGRRLFDCVALYVPNAGDLSDFWSIVESAEKFLRLR